MRRFRIVGEIYGEDAAEIQGALAAAHERHERPLCLCRGEGLPMYIARMGSLYVIKRMPLSGDAHDPSCESHESPYELSGLGALMGSAIQLDAESGMAALKLGFSLSKIGSRVASPQAGPGSNSVSGEARKLSLRGLLHYLWHEAELTALAKARCHHSHIEHRSCVLGLRPVSSEPELLLEFSILLA